MTAPSRILRAVSGALASLSVSLATCLIPNFAFAQLYSWRDADGHAILKTYPPPWYKPAERSRGPRVQVLREGKVIDDTAWPLERRQEGLNQAARQAAASVEGGRTASPVEGKPAPADGLQAAPPEALKAARAAAEQAARRAAEQAAGKPPAASDAAPKKN